MPAYFVIDLDIHDPGGFREYRRRVDALIEKHGGRYLVAAAVPEVLEGQWRPKRLTVIEFPSNARAKAFYESAEFRSIVHLRLDSARTNLVLVEGLEERPETC
jgi:uncharacterized protein (DUF1330 family)